MPVITPPVSQPEPDAAQAGPSLSPTMHTPGPRLFPSIHNPSPSLSQTPHKPRPTLSPTMHKPRLSLSPTPHNPRPNLNPTRHKPKLQALTLRGCSAASVSPSPLRRSSRVQQTSFPCPRGQGACDCMALRVMLHGQFVAKMTPRGGTLHMHATMEATIFLIYIIRNWIPGSGT